MRGVIARELHAPARRHFLTRRVELKSISDLWQADICDMQKFRDKDKKYILTVINCFSKFAYAIPLKTKGAVEVANALRPLFESNKIENFQTDKGTEFYNATLAKLFTKHGINHYSTYTDKKASIVERFNRTLKERMWRMFTEQGSYKWIGILPKILASYNNTKHSTIGMKPREVNKRNEKQVLHAINRATFRRKVSVKPKFSIGDYVRISKHNNLFRKSYLPRWTTEIFRIHSIVQSRPITYTIRDYRNEIIRGVFYESELLKTKHANVYLVEKVLKRRGTRVFVKWLGFDASHNSWISKDNVL